MGIDIKSVPDSFRKKLPAKERKALGKHGMTAAEARERYRSGQEKILQGDIAAWLDIEGIWYTRSRMDRKTTLRKGTPDFICCVNGLFLAIEAKCEGGEVKEEQAEAISRIWGSSGYLHAMVAYTLKQVIFRVKELRAISTPL